MDFKFTDNFEGTLELTKDSYNNLLEIFNLPKEDNEMKNMITVYDIYDIDNHKKNSNQNKTIGIIICKKDNKYVFEYCSDKRIIAREYELV